jgi:hypothetical protein
MDNTLGIAGDRDASAALSSVATQPYANNHPPHCINSAPSTAEIFRQLVPWTLLQWRGKPPLLA